MLKFNLLIFLFIVCITILNYSQQQTQVPTTINDFFLPGSQPNQSGSFNSMPSNCGCHEGYDLNVEPMYTWRGSMMSQAQRDPLYLASLTIAIRMQHLVVTYVFAATHQEVGLAVAQFQLMDQH